MSKISPCLWFARDAEEAAAFYVSLLPDSRIDHVRRSPVDTPSGPAGDVLLVEFTLAGQPYLALNGDRPAPSSMSVSLLVRCDDQAEVDRLWDALVEGGRPLQCGWLVDRWGIHWQIVPRRMLKLLADPVRAPRAMAAMMEMVKLDIAAIEAA